MDMRFRPQSTHRVMFSRYFNSKILLFGEYSIIHHAMGLAVPYDLFQGRLVFRQVTQVSPKIMHSNRELKAFADYLKHQSDQIGVRFDMTSLEFDLEQGLYFESTIPQGFGLGSSGALTTSLYDRYAINKANFTGRKPKVEEILALKEIFALMESHFHGSSSGFDPLICYLNMPLLIRSKQLIEVTEVPDFKSGKGAVFLLNTARPRRTEPLVNLFLEKCKHDDFMQACQDELIPHNDAAIKAFLSGEVPTLFDHVQAISRFQEQYFQPMIPHLFRDVWQEGLQTDAYYLKLCGAGGGGFLLGFAKDFAKAKKLLSKQQVRVVYEL
ncbi:MAG: mevalonate kinase [Bernardetiaceae bacterium]